MIDSMKNSRVYRYALGVGGLHLLGFALFFLTARAHPVLLGMGFLAYTLGLRHAFDADHIVAIDNTVRKLVQQEENPVGVGFFFSLGHSTVVFLMALITALSVGWAQRELPQLQAVGGLIGLAVSGGFLLLIGLLNLFIWLDIYRIFVQMRRRGYDPQRLEQLLLSRGLLRRVAGSLYRPINKSWQVYPLGFLFGLGFDTASEVALLAISAVAAASALPLAGILVLPLLFAAGMVLMDTADGVFMTSAYSWAFATPLRKVYYNLTVTGLSVVAALLIGVIELAQVISRKLGLNGSLWAELKELDFGKLGYLLVGLFVLTWVLSFSTWKLFHLEER